jgi:hypothetical protein
MKCSECKNFIAGICMIAQEGKISELDDPICLMRCQIMLLRSILEELAYEDSDGDFGEEWKNGN